MSVGAEPFVCAACEQTIDRRWWSARDRHRDLPPICTPCEHRYTRSVGEPRHGSFMDRRNAMRISALAECLLGTASSMDWSARYGRA